MNQKQLSYFLAVYKHCGITAAAEELYISPQGLSKMILQLENELGIRLFERTGNRMIPTTDAVNLVSHARTILDEFALIGEKRFVVSKPQHRVRVMVTYDAIQYIPVGFFKKLSEQRPELLLCLEEMPDREIMRGLNEGTSELALLSEPIDLERYEPDFLFSNHFSIVMNRNHPLAAKEQISLGDMKDQPMAIKGMERPFSALQNNAFIKAGVEPYIVLEVSDAKAICRMAEEGYAVGIVLDYVAEDIHSEQLAVRPMVGENSAKSIFLVRKKGAKLSPEAEIVYNALKEWYA